MQKQGTFLVHALIRSVNKFFEREKNRAADFCNCFHSSSTRVTPMRSSRALFSYCWEKQMNVDDKRRVHVVYMNTRARTFIELLLPFRSPTSVNYEYSRNKTKNLKKNRIW